MKCLAKYQLYFVSLIFNCCTESTQLPTAENATDVIIEWGVDTIRSINPSGNGDVHINSLWGANDTNVFAVGRDSYAGGVMWQYNGREWARKKLFSYEGGQIKYNIDFYSVFGFNQNKIFAFGHNYFPNPNGLSSAVMFDGVSWSEQLIPKGPTMYSAAAYSENDFYVGGTDGQLFHLQNGVWSVDTINSSFFPPLPLYNIFPVACTKNGVLIHTLQYNKNLGKIYLQFLLYRDSSAALLDSSTLDDQKWGDGTFWVSPLNRIYAAGSKGVTEYSNGEWIVSLGTESMTGIYGTSDDHIFALAESGNLYLFNGLQWRIIKKIENFSPVYGRIWCTSKTVYISIDKQPNNYIYIGKTKETDHLTLSDSYTVGHSSLR